MTRVLIVRTISIEEMSGVAAACRDRWPDAFMSVLSSPNRRSELLGLGCIDEVLEYPASGGFREPWTDGRRYDAVVVPARNGTAWGYGNVWRAIAPVTSSSHWIAQWGSTLRGVGIRQMLAKSRVECLVQQLCAWPARVLGLLFLTHAARERETTS